MWIEAIYSYLILKKRKTTYIDVDYKIKICEANYSLIDFIFFEFIKKMLRK
jgi:hypothetical protein